MKSKVAQLGWLAVLLGAAFWAGASFQPQSAVIAETRKGARPQAFLSGAERSLPVLQEMSETLKRMEACLLRIEKIETSAAKR
ncbi:MAG: hypothetical protein HQ582_32995 [Planctomycetes bacterium]|nr:hypothetical protein [Planctomycetota bacterium]